jgi:hypothetical protein
MAWANPNNNPNQAWPATDEEIILYIEHSPMRITPRQYWIAHNNLIRRIHHTVDLGNTFYVRDDLVRIMEKRCLDPSYPAVGYALLPVPKTRRRVLDPLGWQFWPDGWEFEMPNSNNDTPILVPSPVNGLQLLHADVHMMNMPQFRIDSDGRNTTELLLSAQGAINAAGELVPLFVAAPVVVELVNPLNKRTKRVHAYSWLFVTAEWDPDLELALLRLPDDSELEYVSLRPEVEADDVKAIYNMIIVAVGNALMDDEDRERIKTEKNLTHLMRLYWERLASIGGSFNSLVLSTVASGVHEGHTSGMERVR